MKLLAARSELRRPGCGTFGMRIQRTGDVAEHLAANDLAVLLFLSLHRLQADAYLRNS